MVSASKTPTPPRTKYSARIIERVVDLLFCLAKQDRPVGVTELAGQLELSKATVFRLLQTLVGKGLVARDVDEGTYILTARVLGLGVRFLPNQLGAVARPHLARLRDLTRETATFSVRVGDERVFLDVLPSPQEVKMVPEMGRAVPLTRGASGKLLLAFTDLEVRERVVRAALSTRPRRQVEAYLAELEQIRHDGHATSVQERTPGASSLAAAVRDRTGEVVAAVALSAPATRLDAGAMKQALPIVLDTAHQISRELGYAGPAPGGRKA
jgi:DNA-binding IclR family transcriptional regulator